ncbi:MAG: DNA mismatch repair endonuclease MutL, partial [Phycisphaeraceae bacterium]
LAVAAHATSKLEKAEELEAVNTLGFRGEALASIASVSRLRITTRPTRDGRTADAAFVLEASGEDIADVRPASGKPGTVVEIRDLFFNTPARRKFLRTTPTEFGHVSDTLARIAMVHPGVGFTLTHNGRVNLDLPPRQDRLQRVIDLLGRELEEALLPFEHRDPASRGGSGVWGLAGLPSIARGSSKFQHLCVNGRPIRDRSLAHALKEAYRGLIPPDRFPVAVVMLELDPATVDVNVHPAKAEVRFRNPSLARGLVLNTVRQRLLASDLTPRADLGPSIFDRKPEPVQRTPFDEAGENAANRDTPATQRQAPVTDSQSFVDYFRRMDPKQQGFVYQQVKAELGEDAENEPEAHQAASHAAAERSEAAGTAPAASILQVHDSYLVTQDEQGLLIVDQHALHERVMFEQLRQRIVGEGKPLESQRLLMPEVLDADASRQATLEELRPLLERIGIEAEPIGPKAVAVQSFPSLLFSRGVEVRPFVEELLDKAQAGDLGDLSDLAELTPLPQTDDANTIGSDTAEAALHEVLDMMSCKAAVKAHDRLSDTELNALLAQRETVERSSNCPHGRPTTLRLSLQDLARQFGR